MQNCLEKSGITENSQECLESKFWSAVFFVQYPTDFVQTWCVGHVYARARAVALGSKSYVHSSGYSGFIFRNFLRIEPCQNEYFRKFRFNYGFWRALLIRGVFFVSRDHEGSSYQPIWAPGVEQFDPITFWCHGSTAQKSQVNYHKIK